MSEPITPELILEAYAGGFFPMAEKRDAPVGWYSPDPRTILPLDRFHVSRSLRRTVTSGKYTVTADRDFPSIISLCASRDETWISPEISGAYNELFDMGYAHSVEARDADGLAGGLYGVALGGAFFGESMVSIRTDASKSALVWLVERLRERGFVLLDVQFQTPHLARFGTVEIPRNDYLRLLAKAIRVKAAF
jgi:leucyl/phenylalanyl-tRNA--protein transferase